MRLELGYVHRLPKMQRKGYGRLPAKDEKVILSALLFLQKNAGQVIVYGSVNAKHELVMTRVEVRSGVAEKCPADLHFQLRNKAKLVEVKVSPEGTHAEIITDYTIPPSSEYSSEFQSPEHKRFRDLWIMDIRTMKITGHLHLSSSSFDLKWTGNKALLVPIRGGRAVQLLVSQHGRVARAGYVRNDPYPMAAHAREASDFLNGQGYTFAMTSRAGDSIDATRADNVSGELVVSPEGDLILVTVFDKDSPGYAKSLCLRKEMGTWRSENVAAERVVRYTLFRDSFVAQVYRSRECLLFDRRTLRVICSFFCDKFDMGPLATQSALANP
ncbi:MAG: hypothetical protein JST35_05410 [Armatimonadetes bacterium]|nr:hypothetical protein [Armatimonadota bacterium]